MKYDKYRQMDWKEIQARYDSGVSTSNLGCNWTCLAWAKQNGLFIPRNKSEASLNNWKTRNRTYSDKRSYVKRSVSKRQKTKSKYESIDWKIVQEKYDAGGTWETLGYTTACLSWAVKNKKLITRTQSEANKLAWKSGKYDVSVYRTEEFRKKQAKRGGIKPNAGRCKCIKHISPIAGEVYLNGTWEYKYALWLDANNINWKRNTKGFSYVFDGKQKKYYPDFYLIDENKYVEVKGYETEKDKEKWSQFPEKLMVLKKIELNNAPYNLNLR